MKNEKIRFAIDYINAWTKQSEADDAFDSALRKFNYHNSYASLVHEDIEKSYSNLLEFVIGRDNFDLVGWWMFESNFGTYDLTFTVDNVKYKASELTAEEFLNLVWCDDDVSEKD